MVSKHFFKFQPRIGLLSIKDEHIIFISKIVYEISEIIKISEINTPKEYILARYCEMGGNLLTTDLSNLSSVFRDPIFFFFFYRFYPSILSNNIKRIYIYVGRLPKLRAFKTDFYNQPINYSVVFGV